MTHDVNSSLRLGSLHETGLGTLAADWLAAGAGDRLAVACEQAWVELTRETPPLAVYWYDEVAAGRAPAVCRDRRSSSSPRSADGGAIARP